MANAEKTSVSVRRTEDGSSRSGDQYRGKRAFLRHCIARWAYC